MAALLIFNYSCHGIGTGGTIAGTGQFMKMMNPNVMIVLADPEGSGLYNKVRSVKTEAPINDISLQFRSSSE